MQQPSPRLAPSTGLCQELGTFGLPAARRSVTVCSPPCDCERALTFDLYPLRLLAKGQQFDEGIEEGLQPALVGHTLLNHFLLAGIVCCLLDTVRLKHGDETTSV